MSRGSLGREQVPKTLSLSLHSTAIRYWGPSKQTSTDVGRDVSWLGEPRPTSIDVCFESPQYRIAVECKLSEIVFGTCSRLRLPRDNPSYCDGSYTIQHGRRARCALTEIGVR